MTQGKYEKRIKALELRARAEDSSDRALRDQIAKLDVHDADTVQATAPEPGSYNDPGSHVQSVRNAMGLLARRVDNADDSMRSHAQWHGDHDAEIERRLCDIDARVKACFQPTLTVMPPDFDPDRVARVFQQDLQNAQRVRDTETVRADAMAKELIERREQAVKDSSTIFDLREKLAYVERERENRQVINNSQREQASREYSELWEKWRQQGVTIQRLHERIDELESAERRARRGDKT